MIPFESWDGNNNFSGFVEQSRLESYFGPSAVVFGTYQAAIASILECLGSRTGLIPVVMAITTPPDTLAGVLRAGGDPILLDICPQTLQVDPEVLAEVLTELDAAVVVLTRPGGQPVDPRILEVVGENPTILDSRLMPSASLELDCVATFNVFDFGGIIGSGALVIHKFSEQVRELKLVRNGLLGLSGNLNELLAAGVLKRLKEDPGLSHKFTSQNQAASLYLSKLNEQLVIPFVESPTWPYFIVRVRNANEVIAQLHNTVEIVKPVFPLHLLSEVNRRWVEKPSYPVAESLTTQLVALPTHVGMTPEVIDTLVKELCEIGGTV